MVFTAPGGAAASVPHYGPTFDPLDT